MKDCPYHIKGTAERGMTYWRNTEDRILILEENNQRVLYGDPQTQLPWTIPILPMKVPTSGKSLSPRQTRTVSHLSLGSLLILKTRGQTGPTPMLISRAPEPQKLSIYTSRERGDSTSFLWNPLQWERVLEEHCYSSTQ